MKTFSLSRRKWLMSSNTSRAKTSSAKKSQTRASNTTISTQKTSVK